MKSNHRFTVLTPYLIRCEYHPEGCFEDRPTQWVISRDFERVDYGYTDENDIVTLETEAMKLSYHRMGGPFDAKNLSVQMRSGAIWRYGDPEAGNLGGTARTLDECDGPMNRRLNQRIQIHPGIFSRSGIAILDDSNSMIIREDNLTEERESENIQDFYIFGYGTNFEPGLRDFYRLCGQPPLLPKWALGVWWSRWEKYKAEDLLKIARDFEEYGVPLSVLVIDMDWHIIHNPYHSGWTGYTWNPDCFPDPEEFFRKVHQKRIRTCLNLHPAEGCHPHEEAYPRFARHMGLDPADGQPVMFNPTDLKFIEGYFQFLHHPHEAIGADFWWIDWQQGEKTRFGNIDPLWLLNHLHSRDIARNGDRRPFVFSRWCGPGAHRYPIGFSGDTYQTWASLQYQPQFTARAANLGFGWWSHDIGGFARGIHDDERYLRWVQFGCFSPIFRFHNAGDPTVDHCPWSKPVEIANQTRRMLKLRQALVPYIYTQARVNASGGFPLMRPMYFHHGDIEEAYHLPNQYYFGPDIIVAPVTEPVDPETGCASATVWLPKGDWCDFFTGQAYTGGRFFQVDAGLECVPAFVPAGAILPLAASREYTHIQALCFAGQEGTAELYLDDGESMKYQDGQFARMRLSQKQDGNDWLFEIEKIEGVVDFTLRLEIVFRGYKELKLDNIRVNGIEIDPELRQLSNGDFCLNLGQVTGLSCTLRAEMIATSQGKRVPDKAGCIELLRRMPINAHFVRPLLDNWEETLRNPQSLSRYACDFTDAQWRVLVNYLYDTGFAVKRSDDLNYLICWWQGNAEAGLELNCSAREECDWRTWQKASGTPHGSRLLTFKSHFHRWRLDVKNISRRLL